MSNINDTLKERGARYGEFIDNATIAQNIKLAMRDSAQWNTMPEDMREGLDIIAGKISRLLTGDPFYKDNWHDIIGYAKLIEDRLEQGLNTRIDDEDMVEYK